MKKVIIIAAAVIFVAVVAVLIYVSNAQKETENKELETKIETSIKGGKLKLKDPKIMKQVDKERLRKMVRIKKKENEADAKNEKNAQPEQKPEQEPESESESE